MAAPGAIARAPPAPSSDLVDAVRHWVHFDNLAETLQKQVTNARDKRADFEAKILTYLETTAMRGATLQITGATLQRSTRPKTTDLSWSFLESHLHEYYKTKGRPDETAAIVEFLQSKRDTRLIPFIKKTAT